MAPRNQENRNKENTRRVVPVETTTPNALISCDGLGSNSEVSTDSNCSSSCLENVKILKEQNEQLLKDLRTSKLNTIAYKTGLESVEARLLVYKKNKSIYEENIKLLKREINLKEVAITELRRKLELAQKQKDEIQLTVEKFENSSKNINKLLDCQIVDKCKIGLGYNTVPPPYTRNFMPPKHDLYSLEEFVNEPIVNEPTVKKSVVETSEAKASADKPKVVRKNNRAPIIEDWVSDNEEEDIPQAKKEKKTVKSSFSKIKFVKSKEEVKSPRKTTVKQGSNFEMINKACYVCGSFDHLQYDCDYHQRQFNNKKMVKPVWNYTQRVNHQNFSRMTHPSPKRNMVPKAVLMRSGLVSLTTARPVNTAQPRTTVNSARPMTNVFNKAHSTVRRPINNKTTTKNSNFNKRVNTVSGMNVNTARPKAVVNAARPKAVLNVVKGNQVNVVKASACWVWKPKTKIQVSDGLGPQKRLVFLPHVHGNPHIDLHDQGVIDSGCSRHMTGNMSYLTDFEEIDKGYVAFGGNPKEGKITGKCTIKTGKFDGKADEGFFVGYSINSKAFRVFNNRTRIVEENLHVQFSENTPNITGSRPNWLFDIDALKSKARMETVPGKDYILLPLWPVDLPFSQNSKSSPDAGFKPSRDNEKKVTKEPGKEGGDSSNDQEKEDNAPQTRRMTKNLEEHGLFSSVQQRTNHKDFQNCLFACFLSQEEPKKVIHALKDPSWIEAMQEELLQFKLQEVWTLVDLPNGKRAIGTKWVFRNKKDERGIMIKNKARLVAQGYTQEEGIDYDEVFAPVARIEAIRLFLAYASFKDFMVIYVVKPPGFEDPNFPDRVYKVEKALYGLHQAPRAWYETLSTYLLDNGFQRGKIDKTLFIRRDKGDILLVQVYVDDIIFGSTKKSLCTEFEKMMHKKFQMSYMGELTFFLGLQVKQKNDGIFISQDKYVTEILKKFGFTDVKTASTPMETQKPLLKDEDGEEVDVHLYRSMIGSLMYLTSSRPDIMFAVCACARYQVNPKVSHLHAVKRIFRYLKGQPKLGLWYPKDSPFDLVAYTDSDYAGASLDRKSTTGGCQFLGCRLISWQCKKQTVVANSTTEAEYVVASSCCGQVLWIQNQLLDYGYNFMHTKIYIDNESTICIVKNLVFHSKIKHIEIRHHFIRDSNEKKLIQMIKIHTDKNVADLLTKAFDIVDSFEWASSIIFLDNQLEGMINHNRIYIAPSHTKNVFANMKRQGTDFSGRVTPLFSTMMVQAQQEQGEGLDMPTDPHHTPTIIPPSTSQPQRKQRPRKPKRKDTKIPQSSVPVENVADEAVYKERDDSLERATTTDTGLDVEQDRGNIFKTQSKATPNEPSSIGTSSGGGPRRQDTMGDTIAQTRSENVSKFSNDPLLAGVNTPRSGEDSLQLKELMKFCTKLQQRVLDLENTKTAQVQEITSLEKRVKKLERKKKSRTHGLKRLYKVSLSARTDSSDDEATLGDQEDASKQGRKIHDIDADEDITLENVHDVDMFGVHDLDGDEVFIETKEPVVNAATTTSTILVSAAKDL
ncbi:putative ribonuclease H-like domain-containing protein, partial [Tanacetum coccineum]